MFRIISVSTIAATLGIVLAHFAQSALAPQTVDGTEEWVHPNLVRVQLDGSWHEFPLVELMDPKCRALHPSAPGC